MKTAIFTSRNEDISIALDEIKESINSRFGDYDLLIASSHPKYNKNIKDEFDKRFGNKRYIIFNATNAFINDEIVYEQIAVTLFKFNNSNNFEIFCAENIKNNKKDAISKTVKYIEDKKGSFHLMIAEYLDGYFSLFLDELSDNLKELKIDNIAGGICSGFSKEQNKIFLNEKTINDGFVMITFKNISYKIGISLGFKPYGITYEITKSNQNKIYEVDNGISFRGIVKNIFKGIDSDDKRYLWYLPLNIIDEKDGFVSTLRNIKDIKDDCVELFGAVKNNQHFKLSFATEEELIESDKKIAKLVSKELKEPEMLFNFSCIARQFVLNELQREENIIYHKEFNVPLFGFFTFGEIGPDRALKRLKLYNETSLLIGIKES